MVLKNIFLFFVWFYGLSLGMCIYRTTQAQKKSLTDIHALSGIRTHDPSIQAGEGGSCLRTRGHFDGLRKIILIFTCNLLVWKPWVIYGAFAGWGVYWWKRRETSARIICYRPRFEVSTPKYKSTTYNMLDEALCIKLLKPGSTVQTKGNITANKNIHNLISLWSYKITFIEGTRISQSA
jgi:hypothetical protein